MNNNNKIVEVTNLLFIKNNKVLLGMKKRGFGKDKYNGFGGKLKPGETIEEAAIREAIEESGLRPLQYEKVAIIDFPNSYSFRMNLFVCHRWAGEVVETEEMRPEWFSFETIPYDKLWEDDIYWLPLVLNGKKIKASFIFANDDDLDGTANNKIVDHKIDFVETLD